jgi:hypothetical protein
MASNASEAVGLVNALGLNPDEFSSEQRRHLVATASANDAGGLIKSREWHPGVSLRAAPLTFVNEFIPMLHGSSGDHGPVVARGLSREKGPNYPTSFGGIVRPARVCFKDASAKMRAPGKRDLEGRMICRSPVSANLDKPRLSEAELADLRSWAHSHQHPTGFVGGMEGPLRN